MDFAKASVQTYASFEQIENGLSGVLGSAEKGKEFFEDMRSFSFETTFGVDTLSAAATQLLNIGIAANKVKPSLKMIGDIAGGDTMKFNELVSIFTKIQNTGKASKMQLEQLALRGVPIYQTLKDIGVEGTASAEDITRAFEKMTTSFDEATGKAGIFYNNMERINDTISGREGFVSDTWREMLAGFAESAGLATAYKAILDLVYEKLQGIVDILAVINSNPVYQALFRGVLVAGITALTVAIAGPLLAALKATIVQLGIIAGLKAVISPVALAAGIAGIAAGVGVTAFSLAQHYKTTEEAEDELTKTTRELFAAQTALNDSEKKLTFTMEDNTLTIKEQTVEIGDQVIQLKELAAAYDEVQTKEFRKEKKKVFKEVEKADKFNGLSEQTANKYREIRYKDALADFNWAEQVWAKNYMELGADHPITKEAEQYMKEVAAELKRVKYSYNDLLRTQEESNKAEERKLQLIEEEKKANEAYAAALADIESKYTQTDEGKKWSQQKELEKYKKLLEDAENPAHVLAQRRIRVRPDTNEEYLSYEAPVDEEHIKMLKVVVADLENEINGTTKSTEKAKNEIASWQKVMQSLFDFSDDDVKKFLDTGIHGLEEYENRVKEKAEALEPYWEIITGGTKQRYTYDTENAKSAYEESVKSLQTLLTARDEKTGKLIWNDKRDENGNVVEDESIKLLKQQIEAKRKTYMEASMKEELELLKKQGKQLGLNAKELEVIALMEEKGYDHTQAETIALEKMSLEYEKQALAIKKEIIQMGKTKQQLLEIKHIEEGISEEKAKQLADDEAALEKKQQLAEASYLQNKFQEMVRTSAEDYNANGRQNLDAGTYAKGKAGLEALNLIQGTDVGNFVEGFQEGGLVGGVINTLIKALADVIGGIEGLNIILNPVKQLLQAFAPLIKALLYPFLLLANLLAKLGEVIMKVLNVLSFGLIEKLSLKFDSLVQSSDNLAEQQQNEADRLKALNDQYKSLQAAIDEQNQYYLRKKMEVNAQAYDRALSSTSVNDMILTPQGNFSTDPNDYIIATKNPQGLGGGGNTVVQMNVKINNTIANVADVKTTQTVNSDGSQEMVVMISRKIAGDAASGENGWDDAFNAREQRLAGRRVMA